MNILRQIGMNVYQFLENTFENIQRNGYPPLMIISMFIDIQRQIQGEFSKPFTIHNWISN